MNHVIMDYLINEGYPDAAKRFAIEADIQNPPGDTENIQERVAICNAILMGDAAAAIEIINETDSEVSLFAAWHVCFAYPCKKKMQRLYQVSCTTQTPLRHC